MESFGNISKKSKPKTTSGSCSKTCSVKLGPSETPQNIPLTSCDPQTRYNTCTDHIFNKFKDAISQMSPDNNQINDMMSGLTKQKFLSENEIVRTECNKCKN